MDLSFSRHANSAGMALPRIPRRTSSTGSTRSAHVVQAVLSRSPPTPTNAKVVVQPPTPPGTDRKSSSPVASSSKTIVPDASSGSGSDTLEMLAPKSRRSRSYQRGALPSSMRPPEQSTPTPASLQTKGSAKEVRIPFPTASSPERTPRPSLAILAPKPRPSISPLGPSAHSEIAPSRSVSVGVEALIRKKSGEPLKSSLKARRPVIRGGLSVVIDPITSKSEPSTPTCSSKSVHFDSKLEHVKLFLAEQKPLAVSRDGSPTDDTSGTESDFPAFIYGKDDKAQLAVIAIGPKVESVEERENVDVKLESVRLGEDGNSIVGQVRVKNLAFEKWVAVRFTCDWWQTTSEVTARYLETLPGTNGQHDRFQFTIRLNDMMSRIEEKTMFLAVRYSAAGREMWDNNGGQNYKVTFARQKVPLATKQVGDESGRSAGMAVLKSKLEEVAQAGENRSTVGGFLSLRSQRSQSMSPPVTSGYKVPSESRDTSSFTLKSTTPLSSRYDFGASLKSNWRRAASDSTSATHHEHSRTNTHPTTVPQFPRRTPADKRTIIELTRGSPRIFDTHEASTPSPKAIYVTDELEDTPIPALSRKDTRNHQRGYFDLGPITHSVRRTPPGSPFGLPSMGGSPSGSGRNSPAKVPEASIMWRVPSGGSEESPPSSNASNEESSRESSPNTSPYEGPVNLVPDDAFPRSPSPGTDSSYSAFLDSFCFFTGSETLSDFSGMHRSHSASSVEEFLSTSPYLGSDYLSPGHTPTRSCSYDDVATMNGDSTPTPRSLAAGAPSVFASPPAATFAH